MVLREQSWNDVREKKEPWGGGDASAVSGKEGATLGTETGNSTERYKVSSIPQVGTTAV